MKNFLKLFYILILLANTALAETENESNSNRCFNKSWERYESVHDQRGTTIAYGLPEGYEITSTNVACIVSIELLRRVDQLPDKAVIALINKDFRSGYLVKWSIKENVFLLVEVHLTSMSAFGKGTFITYPNPLERLREVMLTKRFPKKEELPLRQQHKFRINYVPTSTMDLAKILNKTIEHSINRKLEENSIGIQ